MNQKLGFENQEKKQRKKIKQREEDKSINKFKKDSRLSPTLQRKSITINSSVVKCPHHTFIPRVVSTRLCINSSLALSSSHIINNHRAIHLISLTLIHVSCYSYTWLLHSKPTKLEKEFWGIYLAQFNLAIFPAYCIGVGHHIHHHLLRRILPACKCFQVNLHNRYQIVCFFPLRLGCK